MSMPDKDWPKRLLSWFDANKRDLPWRESKPRNCLLYTSDAADE